jgi:hypothetical protein
MSLCFDIEGEFFEGSELSKKVHLCARTALEGGAAFVEEGALHLCVATAIGLVIVIHFCNYNDDGSFLDAGQVAPLDVLPVDDLPDLLDVVQLDVLVIDVESVLPHVDR